MVGAGPTGLEQATTLADWLPVHYQKLGGDGGQIHVVLLHRGSEILQGDMNYNLRQTVQMALPHRAVPVELSLQTQVMAVRPGGLSLSQQGQTRELPAATCVWTAGTQTHPLLMDLSLPAEQRDGRGQLKVAPTLQLSGFAEVFAGGAARSTLRNLCQPSPR